MCGDYPWKEVDRVDSQQAGFSGNLRREPAGAAASSAAAAATATAGGSASSPRHQGIRAALDCGRAWETLWSHLRGGMTHPPARPTRVHPVGRLGPDNHSLSSRGLSTPRRCSYCNKIMFFKAYRCKQCRYRCHKKCAGSNPGSRRSSSCPKSYSGEEHWTKVLQANEVNSNVVLLPCRSTNPQHRCRKERHHRKSRPQSPCPTPPRIPKGEGKDSNIFTTLYARFCQWVATARREAGGPQSRPLSRSSSVTSGRSQDLLHLLSQLPDDCTHYHDGCIHASLSSEDSDYSLARPSYSSTCSSLTITSTSTTHSDLPALSLGEQEDSFFSAWMSSADSRYAAHSLVTDKRSGLSPLTFTISCPLRTNKPSLSQTDHDKTNLCATWPMAARKKYDKEREFSGELEDYGSNNEDGDEGVFCDAAYPSREAQSLDDPVKEFCISHRDIEFGDCMRVGRRRQVYQGKWHGDVMIHVYSDLPETETKRFLEEVTTLSRIRHENMTLFMGACVQHPHLAVITSVPKGESLYERIHMQREKMSLHTRVNIVRQIAQGLGYLHAKGLVMRKLNSRNLHLEPKVKLSLMDYGMTEAQYDRRGYGCLPRGHLTYIAPEMLRHMRVESPRLVTHTPYTTQTDIYAFGTVLYELVACRFPFRGYGAETLIYSIVKGRRQTLRELHCNNQLKSLIAQCWTHEPDDRPAMSNINKDLQQNGALHKRHSSSEPERLNRISLDKSDAMFH